MVKVKRMKVYCKKMGMKERNMVFIAREFSFFYQELMLKLMTLKQCSEFQLSSSLCLPCFLSETQSTKLSNIMTKDDAR